MSIYTDDTVKKLMFFNSNMDISKYVVPDSFKKQDYICTGQLNFGEVNSTKIQFKTYGNLNLTGSIIKVKFGTSTENALVGTYKVTYSSSKSNSSIVTITAYDAAKEFDRDVSDWYVSQNFPIKLKNLRESLCQYIGITAADVVLINDEIMVYKTVNPSSLNGMDMLFYIGQLNGVFAHAADTYSMEWISLGSEVVSISKSVTYGPKAFEVKSYDTAPIGGLVIRQEDGDIGVTIGTTNKYIVQGNILVYGYSSSELNLVANRLYDKIKNVRYVPCSLKVKYLPDIKMGSMCSYDGNVFYILQRATTGLLFDTLTAGGNEYLKNDNSVESQLEQLRGKANILNRSIEETRNTITDVENGLKNEILATTSEFDVKLQSLQSQVDGEIEVINGHGQPTLYNYPAYNWVAGPKVGDTLTQGLRFTYSDAVYIKHQRTLFFDEDTSTTYRFISKNGVWVWEPLANAEFSLLQKQITDLNVTAQGITQSVEQLSTKVTNEYITQIDAKTLVTTTADGIKEDISKVYSTTDYVNTLKASFDKTAEGLTAQISEVNEALDGANEVYTIRGQPTLYNYPAYNWTAGPKVGDKLTQGLRFTYSDESYRKHKRALVYDEAAGKTYRFIKSGSTWLFSDVGDTEFSFVNKKFAEYKATADGLSADLSRFETKVGSDYITKVDSQASIKLSAEELSRTFSKTYATQDTVSTMEMAIKEAADGLAIRVKKDDLITEINAQAGKAKIKSDAIDLTGLVTISSLKESGKTVINGDNITTGTIRAERLDLTNYSTTRQVDAAIAAAERGIKSTVASSSSKWDYSNYWHSVDYSGYGTPWEAGYTDIGKYKNKTYLDIITGYVYYCTYDDGSYKLDDWFKDYECPVAITELKTSLEQTDKKFNWLVKSGDSEANMVLTDRVYKLVSEHIDLTGLVTISALKDSGHTVINADNLTTGTIKALTISGCTITGSAVAFANDSGGWNTIFNSEGMWIVGNGTVETPDFRVDKWGFLHLGDKLRMNPAGIWWTNNIGIEMFKSWSSFFGV